MPVTRIDFPLDQLTSSQSEEEIQRKLAHERARLASMMGLDSGPVRHFRRPAEKPFTAEERGKVTILFGGLTWKHERVIQAVFQGCGYNCEILPVPNVSAFQLGKEYGNNGQCNPTYFTVGNLVQFLQSLESRGLKKQEIIDNYVFFTAGSCGPCRFGMYESEYRLALQNAGFEGFRVLLFQQNDGVKAASGEAGLKFTVDFGLGMFNALNLGDIMNEMIYRIRPYEAEKGKTDRVFHEAMDALCTMLRDRKPFEDHEDLPEWMAKKIRASKGAKWEIWVNSLLKVREQLYGKPYKEALQAVHDQLGTIEVDRLKVKPVVKIIGEFWAQITEGDGNFHMFEFLEREGAQVLVEPIGTWIMYMIHQVIQKYKDFKGLEEGAVLPPMWKLGTRAKIEFGYRQKVAKLKLAEAIFKGEYHKIVKALGGIAHHLTDQYELQRLGHPFYNSRAGGGEGHLEVAKNIYYSNKDLAHMVLSLKPFGCMPSTQSDGAQSAVVSNYKDMIYLPIETSGEGEINAHSRVQMALGEAKNKAKKEFAECLERSGLTLEGCRAYVDAHPEMKRPMYQVPHTKGVVGSAANFVMHLAERMKAGRN